MRGSRVISLVVVFSLLFTSVVYACSGLSVMQMSFMSSSMDERTVERGPCSKHKQDICKSVRERMLSRQVSLVQDEITLHVATLLQSEYLVIRPVVSLLPTAGPPGIIFHAASEISFPFLSRVLRI